MPAPTFLEYAKIADASYYYRGRPTPNFTRLHFGQLTSGFKGAYYGQADGASPHIIVAFAGTDDASTEQVDSGDEMADAGFLGPAAGTGLAVLSGLGGAVALAGMRRLMEQVSGAEELTRQAMNAAGPHGNVYICGHSLGGGLAQIVCKSFNKKGVAFNAPATTQLNIGRLPRDRFVNINERNDPVSGVTGNLGEHQGRTVTINAGVSGGEAHSLSTIIRYLESTAGAALGARRPY